MTDPFAQFTVPGVENMDSLPCHCGHTETLKHVHHSIDPTPDQSFKMNAESNFVHTICSENSTTVLVNFINGAKG